MNYAASPLEIKELGTSGHIEGLLAGFGNVDSHGDVVAPGAFSKSLTERNGRPLPMLLHHDMNRPIGVFTSWEERDVGLYVKGELELSVRDAQDAHALAKRGALTGLSIGFRTKQASRDTTTGANLLTELDLHEGSLVTVPSNPKTHVSTVKAISGPRDIAALLQDGGVSGRKAKAAAGLAWRMINETQVADEEFVDILKQSANRIAQIGAIA